MEAQEIEMIKESISQLKVSSAIQANKLDYLQKQVDSLSEIAIEIRDMNTNIANLTMEIKNTNEHLFRVDKQTEKIDERIEQIEKVPNKRWELIVTGILSAVVSGIVGIVISFVSNGI